MNVDNLRINYPKLLSQMKEAGYSDDYIGRFRKEICWILAEAEAQDWKSYKDIYQFHESLLLSKNELVKKHAILGALEQFDLHGKYPDSKWKNLKNRETTYQRLIPEYQRLVDFYVRAAGESGKKESTIAVESGYAATFLLAVQNSGFSDLEDITEEAVMELFVSPEGKPLKSHTNRQAITTFLKTCIPINADGCRKVALLLPKTRSARKNIQYLTAEEITRIREALNDMTNALSLCDRAIGKLAMYTGLRGSDIANLELDSINWKRDTISISQQKTNIPLELPLTAIVGNAIYDYLTNERPTSDNHYLFLTMIGSLRKVTSSNVKHASIRIMKAAGVRQAEGDRKGLHIFRHHVATTLLGNEVSQAVISRMLGHYSPDSTETYLSADFIHLKTCALSISQFPISEEVFSVG